MHKEAGLRARQRSLRLVLTLAGAALFVGSSFEARRWSALAGPDAAAPSIAAPTAQRIRISEVSSTFIEMPEGAQHAHASALAVLPGDAMLAFWWAGSRESAPDVQVFSSRWSNGEWSAPRVVVDRKKLAGDLGFGVRRLGNPAAWAAQDGKVHLFVVATGFGGWAASRVVHLVSADEGESFRVRRVLPLSPLFNISVLVRTTPVGLADGGWWLPLYFEMGNKYPMIMSFDHRGQPRGLARIGERITSLQPAVVAVSGTEWRAWMRDMSEQRRVQQAQSRDGGASWEDLPAMELPNHDSSVAALRLRNGGFVLLHNHRVTEDGSPRSVLRLSHSTDAKAWTHDLDVVAGDPLDEFSYPSVQQVGDELHVTYSAQRRGIAHRVYRIRYGDAAP